MRIRQGILGLVVLESLFLFSHLGVVKWSVALLPDERNNIEIYKRCNPATVNITTTTLRQNFWMEVYPQEGVGSGVIVRKDGYIVTNNHVLGNAHKIVVTLFDKTEFQATVKGRDPATDLAVIQIDPRGRKLSVVNYAKVEQLRVGQKALAIGNPFRLGGSLTVGHISALNREMRAGSQGKGGKLKDVIQTDAAINPGNSGGPLLDSSGNLIGINTQIITTSGGSEGIGFAVSVKTVKKVVEQLIRFGQVMRPWIGLDGVGLGGGVLRRFKIGADHGVMVTAIGRGSPAEKAGLQRAKREAVWGFQRIPYGGDVITRIDKTPMKKIRDIQDYVFEKKIGDHITLHFFRGKKKRKVTIRLGPQPGQGVGI